MKLNFTESGNFKPEPKRSCLKFKQLLLLSSHQEAPISKSPIKHIFFKVKKKPQIEDSFSPISSHFSFEYSQRVNILNSSRALSPSPEDRVKMHSITYDNKMFELYRKLNKLGKHEQIVPNAPMSLSFEGYQIKLFEISLQSKKGQVTFGVSTQMKFKETILLEIYLSGTLYPNMENSSHQWLILNDQKYQQIKLDLSLFKDKVYVSICSRVTIKIEMQISLSSQTRSVLESERQDRFALSNLIDPDEYCIFKKTFERQYLKMYSKEKWNVTNKNFVRLNSTRSVARRSPDLEGQSNGRVRWLRTREGNIKVRQQ